MNRPEMWRLRAACADHPDPDRWFPGPTEHAVEAKAVCADCPVTAECLAYALRHRIKEGIWGGTSYNERRHIPNPNPRKVADINHATYGGYATHKRRGEQPCEGCLQAYRIMAYEKRRRLGIVTSSGTTADPKEASS